MPASPGSGRTTRRVGYGDPAPPPRDPVRPVRPARPPQPSRPPQPPRPGYAAPHASTVDRRSGRIWMSVLVVIVVAGLPVLARYTGVGFGRSVSVTPGANGPASVPGAPAATASVSAAPSPTPTIVHSGLDTFTAAAGTGPV